MKKEREDLTIRDEAGIIIYDSLDDDDTLFDPSDDGNNEDRDNRDVFTQEYMLEFACKHDAEIARNQSIDRMVSVGVIIGIILFTGLLVWLKF